MVMGTSHGLFIFLECRRTVGNPLVSIKTTTSALPAAWVQVGSVSSSPGPLLDSYGAVRAGAGVSATNNVGHAFLTDSLSGMYLGGTGGVTTGATAAILTLQAAGVPFLLMGNNLVVVPNGTFNVVNLTVAQGGVQTPSVTTASGALTLAPASNVLNLGLSSATFTVTRPSTSSGNGLQTYLLGQQSLAGSGGDMLSECFPCVFIDVSD